MPLTRTLLSLELGLIRDHAINECSIELRVRVRDHAIDEYYIELRVSVRDHTIAEYSIELIELGLGIMPLPSALFSL